MPKYTIGIAYTVWVDVEADSEEAAIEVAVNTPYDFVDVARTGALMELNEFDDPRVYTDDDELYSDTVIGVTHLG